MQELDELHRLTTAVLASAFAAAVVFGAIAQRTHFCTMGAIADIVNMGDWSRMRMWVLAVAVAVLGFNTMVALEWVQAGNSLYAGPRLSWLSLLCGGLMFGFGMVLASGCGSKNLVRAGAGNLKAWVVLLVLGLSAFATLKGITAVLRVATVDRIGVDLPSGQDLPHLLSGVTGLAVPTLAGWLGLLVAALLLAWVLRTAPGRNATVWLGGAGIGGVIVVMWWISGRLGFVAEHAQTLEPTFLATNSHNMESMSMVAPVGFALDWLLFFSDQSKTLTIGIVSMAGVVVGSALMALASREFRWEGFANVEDTANHLAGGVLMGVGGVSALGCTIGQGLSGISTLSLGSMLAIAAIVTGGIAGLRYQIWRMDRLA
ncbi:MAG: YeeE/YedE family protein [Burkholderiaceae bacterium]